MSGKLINFNAGPAALPEEVIREAAAAVIEYNNSGLSILEIPHRDKLFLDIINEANLLVKELLHLNDDYDVLWLQGGGRLQFSMIPMNFLGEEEYAGYIDSGHWAADAISAARMYGRTDVIASSKENNYRNIPSWTEIPDHLSYLHITTNNTIYGTQFRQLPDTSVPLIADMSSELFSRVIDYNQFSLIYAVAQKNIGPAGVTLVVVRRAMLKRKRRTLPGILDYAALSKNNSILNTPPVFAIYCSLLTLRWIKKQGLETIEERNNQKSAVLYQAVDESRLFYGIAEKQSRSNMNVCFRMHEEERTQQFIDFALSQGITGIKGHRSVGGLRVSLYNAIRFEDVLHLVQVMKEFER